MNLEKEMYNQKGVVPNSESETLLDTIFVSNAIRVAKQYAKEMCKRQNAINMEICLSYIELTILDKERAMGVNERTKVLGDILNAPLATEKK